MILSLWADHECDREQNGPESMQEALPSVVHGGPSDLKQKELSLRWGACHRYRGMAKGPGLTFFSISRDLRSQEGPGFSLCLDVNTQY